jgi:hypothetical protein
MCGPTQATDLEAILRTIWCRFLVRYISLLADTIFLHLLFHEHGIRTLSEVKLKLCYA